MITNREEVIDKAFKVFLKMNYEKASISTLAKACGVVKTGVVYYFPHKLDLFMAVADKYAIQMQTPSNKFAEPAETLAEFIDQYVAGVRTAMNRIVKLVECSVDNNDCCPNFYYFHFLSQVRMYYPGVREKMENTFQKMKTLKTICNDAMSKKRKIHFLPPSHASASMQVQVLPRSSISE